MIWPRHRINSRPRISRHRCRFSWFCSAVGRRHCDTPRRLLGVSLRCHQLELSAAALALCPVCNMDPVCRNIYIISTKQRSGTPLRGVKGCTNPQGSAI